MTTMSKRSSITESCPLILGVATKPGVAMGSTWPGARAPASSSALASREVATVQQAKAWPRPDEPAEGPLRWHRPRAHGPIV